MADGVADSFMKVPVGYAAPGEVDLLKAIKDFCARLPDAATVLPTPFALLERAGPVRDALVIGNVKAKLITPIKPPADVNPAAFRDDTVWRIIVWGADTFPTRPDLGIEPGRLVVSRDEFDAAVRVGGGEAGPSSQSPGPPRRYVPPYIRLALEVSDRLDLSADYPFDITCMEHAIIEIGKELRWKGLRLSRDRAKQLARLLNHPQFANVGYDPEMDFSDPDPVDLDPPEARRNDDRPKDPIADHNQKQFLKSKTAKKTNPGTAS